MATTPSTIPSTPATDEAALAAALRDLDAELAGSEALIDQAARRDDEAAMFQLMARQRALPFRIAAARLALLGHQIAAAEAERATLVATLDGLREQLRLAHAAIATARQVVRDKQSAFSRLQLDSSILIYQSDQALARLDALTRQRDALTAPPAASPPTTPTPHIAPRYAGPGTRPVADLPA